MAFLMPYFQAKIFFQFLRKPKFWNTFYRIFVQHGRKMDKVYTNFFKLFFSHVTI